ncbi:MAG TPA: hypothetical protein VKA49_08200 [Flavitalea sp.]|nr:hypothetical protein [Flavitalea sp.]
MQNLIIKVEEIHISAVGLVGGKNASECTVSGRACITATIDPTMEMPAARDQLY